MMNEYELQVYVNNHLKEMEHHYTSPNGTHLHENVKDMTLYLKQKVASEEWSVVRRIFDTAEHLYERGSQLIRIVIENVFVFSS